jgi:6-pyruvoyltetrahydropterin/6-carboxytetrahydropterin synthase
MLARVAKEFDFHAAHVLPNHDGQCRRLHGHTYRLRVVVEGWVRPVGDDLPDEGMVVDFKVLKDIYKTMVEPEVEHQNLNATLVDTGLVPVSTCECVARWILHRFRTGLEERHAGTDARVVCVRLWETPTSWAEVS